MVNYDRIVPVQKIDLLSLYATILNLMSASYSVAEAIDTQGTFILEGNGTYLANQPVRSLDFGDATAATVYFIATYDFDGFLVGGNAETYEGEVKNDGVTLYKAVLADTAITVTAVTPSV